MISRHTKSSYRRELREYSRRAAHNQKRATALGESLRDAMSLSGDDVELAARKQMRWHITPDYYVEAFTGAYYDGCDGWVGLLRIRGADESGWDIIGGGTEETIIPPESVIDTVLSAIKN